jgi:branched-chain amino acid transport system substrate-binding protein
MKNKDNSGQWQISRRNILRAGGAAAGTLLSAPYVRAASANTIKIGFVSPASGPLAAFGESDQFTIGQVKKALAGGLKIGGTNYDVEIIYRDSQSDSNRASDAAAELILNEQVNLILGASTPATTIPVADQAELNGVPCITNDTPWQPWFFGRKGDPSKGFQWTYHFFWGLEDIIGSYTSMWQQVSTNKMIGALWPNDPDGNAWADPTHGFPPVLSKQGFGLTDLGRFPLPADNFSSFISAFKKNDVEIVTGVIPPPDFANFWNQAGQQGFKPKVVTAAKATEFPAAIKAFGDRADGLSVEVWWAPVYPFSSSLTGQTSAQLAQAFTAATGKQWSMPLGFRHALFEVAVDALKRSASTDPNDIRAAIAATNLPTVTGTINFAKGPVPNVSKTPLTGGQWRKAGNGFDLILVDNSQALMVPVHDKLQVLG